jgi:ASC-1-like (ASCH) protein
MKIGAKKCEGRLNKGDFQKMEKGDMINLQILS